MAASDELPRFFSVFISQYSSESLLIPTSYYEHLPRQLPKTTILMGTGGRIWKVAMTSKREKVYFGQGWASFMADNELKDGEFLTFVFDGYQTYEVSIYGHGGCKEIRSAIQVEELSDETDIEAEVADITDNGRCKKIIENPEAYLDDPNNLHFLTSLKIRNYELVVNAQIVKDYDLKFGTCVDLIDRHGKLTGRRVNWADHRICIKRWKSICDRNKVKKHDSILCELLRTDNNVVYAIKVHITRRRAATMANN